MDSTEDRPSITPSTKLTTRGNLFNYIKSLPSESMTRSSWLSRKTPSTPLSQGDVGTQKRKHPVSSSSSSLVPGCAPFSPVDLLGTSRSSPLDRTLPWPPTLPCKRALVEVSQATMVDPKGGDLPRPSSKIEELSENSVGSQDPHFSDDAEESQIILAVSFSHGKLGAAFYDGSNSQAYVMEDKIETAPEFGLLRSLVRELSPKILLCGGKQEKTLFEVMHQLRDMRSSLGSLSSEDPLQTPERNAQTSKKRGSSSGERGEDRSSKRGVEDRAPSFGTRISDSSENSTQDAFILTVRPAAEFKFETCRRRILLHPWPGVPKDAPPLEKEAWVRGRFDFNASGAVRSLGGLLRFLDGKRRDVASSGSLLDAVPILGLHAYCMEDLVHMDDGTLEFLQIFSEDLHPASSKKGKASASKEGLSLFALFSRTASSLSSNVLRRVMLRPLRNLDVLQSRYDFLSWATKTVNFEAIRQIHACLKNIANVQMLFSRLQRSQLNVRDWKTLYKSLFNMILLGEICASQDQSIEALREVKASTCEDLYHATYLIQRTLDFDQAEREGRFVVKPGLDQDLDDKKRKLSALGEVMNKVGEMELSKLPPDIDSCCVIYLPHIGYLLGIPHPALESYLSTSTSVNHTTSFATENYNIPGLQFMFSTRDMVLFKSALCSEMDLEMGDLQVDIANQETSIMMRLVEVILQQAHAFVKLVSKVFLIDVLLAMSSVCRDLGWVRPSLRSDGKYLVKEGRHPLYEVCNPTFVSNDIIGDVNKSPITLVTGPNASGKTAYVRQVGVIAYLAHLGCFIPAEEMSFTPLDGIFTVAVTTPSVTTGLSTFMVELNRFSVALLSATHKSLVLIDEFGSSTCNEDGEALLVAAFEYWMAHHPSRDLTGEKEPVMRDYTDKRDVTEERGGCPLIFTATHFYNLHRHFRELDLVRELSMETMEEGERVVYLYQLVEGRTSSSHAFRVAKKAGLPSIIVNRAEEVCTCLARNSLPSRWSLLDDEEEQNRCSEIVALFLNFDLVSTPITELLTGLRKYLQDSIVDSLNDSIISSTLPTSLLNVPPPPAIQRSPARQSQGFDPELRCPVSVGSHANTLESTLPYFSSEMLEVQIETSPTPQPLP